MTIRLAPREIASGLVLGEDPAAPALPSAGLAATPLAALEGAVGAALERPPCLVGFSGGRDSSALLAVATTLARRDGYELPVPITLRFPEDPEAEESRWQELVIAELGTSNWLRIDVGDELGVLGQVARAALEQHGLLWPPNVHALVPLLEAAVGGSLIVGVGGDELFGGLPSRRLAFLPMRLRRAVADPDGAAELSWLSREARSALGAALAAEHAGEPIRWRRRVEWLARRRQLSTQRASGEALAVAAGAALVEPFLDPAFLASLARHGNRRTYGAREAAMETLFAGLVPAAVRSRPSKARFNRALWGEDARAFAREWDGDAPFGDLAEPDELRRTWLLDAPDFRSATALQAAWLTQSRATLAAAGAARGDPWAKDHD